MTSYCAMCAVLYTAYLVLTKYWRKVDANMDGIPDEYQVPIESLRSVTAKTI